MNRGEEQAESVTFVRSTTENFENTQLLFMIYPAAIRFTYLQCSFVLRRRLFCRHVYFMTLFTSVKWTSNSSQQPPLQSVWEKPFSLSFSLSLFFFAWIYPPRALEAALLPHGPPVMFICSSTSLWFLWSLFLLRICLCLAGPRTFKMMKGGERKMSGKAIFYPLWCVYGYCSHSLSAHSSRTEKSEENLNKSDKLAWLLFVCPPPNPHAATRTSDWHWERVVV